MAVLAKYVVLTRMQPGCRNIDLCASVTQPGRYLVIQKWESSDAQRAHFDSEVMVEMAQVVQRVADRGARHRPVGRAQRPRPDLTNDHTQNIRSAAVAFDSVTRSPKEASMANPISTTRPGTRRQRDPGWAAPDPETRRTPITDGPVSAWHSQVMTVGGTISATGVLMVLLLAAAVVGWRAAPTISGEVTGFPALALGRHPRRLRAARSPCYFRPMWAKFLGPIYALGRASSSASSPGPTRTTRTASSLQAVGATLGVFAVMLVLYRTRIIKVTDRFRRIVIGATLGLMVFYLVSFVICLFGGGVGQLPQLDQPARHRLQHLRRRPGGDEPGLDFDFIEQGSKQACRRAWSGSPPSRSSSRSCGCTSRCSACSASSTAASVSHETSAGSPAALR